MWSKDANEKLYAVNLFRQAFLFPVWFQGVFLWHIFPGLTRMRCDFHNNVAKCKQCSLLSSIILGPISNWKHKHKEESDNYNANIYVCLPTN